MAGAEDPSSSRLTEEETPRVGTVLVADDERVVRRVASMALGLMGLEVVEAADGHEAVERFEEHRDSIVLVLLDLSMPGRSGRDTLAAIRALAPDVPAIFCSGYSDERVEASERAEFLAKPYRIQDLHDLVARLLDE